VAGGLAKVADVLDHPRRPPAAARRRQVSDRRVKTPGPRGDWVVTPTSRGAVRGPALHVPAHP
jgi:hypothetical protein